MKIIASDVSLRFPLNAKQSGLVIETDDAFDSEFETGVWYQGVKILPFRAFPDDDFQMFALERDRLGDYRVVSASSISGRKIEFDFQFTKEGDNFFFTTSNMLGVTHIRICLGNGENWVHHEKIEPLF